MSINNNFERWPIISKCYRNLWTLAIFFVSQHSSLIITLLVKPHVRLYAANCLWKQEGWHKNNNQNNEEYATFLFSLALTRLFYTSRQKRPVILCRVQIIYWVLFLKKPRAWFSQNIDIDKSWRVHHYSLSDRLVCRERW